MKAPPSTERTPPQAVKSVFVNTAYKVSEITIPAVIAAAARTTKPSLTVAQQKATVQASNRVKVKRSRQFVGTLRATLFTHIRRQDNANAIIAAAIAIQALFKKKFLAPVLQNGMRQKRAVIAN